MSTLTSLEGLKKSLKSWENSFYHQNNRKPLKSDIKAHPTIEAKYREYKLLKLGKPKKDLGLRTPRKHESDQLPISISPSKKIKEIGPTPQLNGRILGIFDINQTTPLSSTPTKEIEGSPKYNITPSAKRKIDFSEINSDNEDNNEETNFVKPKLTKKTLLKYSTPTHSRVLRSPSTPTDFQASPSKFQQTPGYLSQGSMVSIKTPSPKKSKTGSSIFGTSKLKKRRPLSELFKEVEELKNSAMEDEEIKLQIKTELEIKSVENMELDSNRLELIGDMGRTINDFEEILEEQEPVGEEVGEDDHKTKYWLKQKKIKRQTKRIKMKSRGNHEEADITDTEEIAEEIENMQKNLEVKRESAVVDFSDEEFEEEEVEKIEEVETEKENGKKKDHGLAKNYRKYKLQKRGRRGFNRRR